MSNIKVLITEVREVEIEDLSQLPSVINPNTARRIRLLKDGLPQQVDAGAVEPSSFFKIKYEDYLYDKSIDLIDPPTNIDGNRCEWRVDGKLHRENGLPAIVEYYNSGNIKLQEYYVNGQLHNDNGPAVLKDQQNTSYLSYRFEYYKNGMLHRDNGPAIITPKFCEWYKDGKLLFNENQYNKISMDGLSYTYQWLKNKSTLHRETGPAFIKLKHFTLNPDPENCIEYKWYKGGVLHNTTGPAIHNKSGVEYYLNGSICTEAEVFGVVVGITDLKAQFKEKKTRVDEYGNKLRTKPGYMYHSIGNKPAIETIMGDVVDITYCYVDEYYDCIITLRSGKQLVIKKLYDDDYMGKYYTNMANSLDPSDPLEGKIASLIIEHEKVGPYTQATSYYYNNLNKTINKNYKLVNDIIQLLLTTNDVSNH